MNRLGWVVALFGVAMLTQLVAAPAAQQANAGAAAGQVRTYYIAAEEVEWDYAPLGIDMMTGQAFEGTSAAYTQPGPNHIGHIYRKAIYREYTDDTFRTRKPRAAQDEYLGLLGPVLRAEVGDTIKVVFKNNASRPYTMTMQEDVFRPKHPAGDGITLDAEGIANRGVPEDAVQPEIGRAHV